MKLFLDSCILEEINKYLDIISGVTTNSSMKNVNVKEILSILRHDQTLHIQINSKNYNDILHQMNNYHDERIIIKLPMSLDSLRICHSIKNKINITLCFTHGQIYTAYLSGAEYISVFLGRMQDYQMDYIKLLKEMNQYNSKILAASIRNVEMFNQALACNIINFTLPYQIMEKVYNHILTDNGYEQFNR